MVTINIEKKNLWLIAAIVMFLVGSGVVVAYTASGASGVTSAQVAANAPKVGHSADEIEILIPTGEPSNLKTGQIWLAP